MFSKCPFVTLSVVQTNVFVTRKNGSFFINIYGGMKSLGSMKLAIRYCNVFVLFCTTNLKYEQYINQ